MRIYPHIHNAEELGTAVLGSQYTDVVHHKFTVDRAEYGRKLAEAEGGVFTSRGYIVPDKDGEVYDGEEANTERGR